MGKAENSEAKLPISGQLVVVLQKRRLEACLSHDTESAVGCSGHSCLAVTKDASVLFAWWFACDEPPCS